MNPLIWLCNHCLNSQQIRSLSCPISTRSTTIILANQQNRWNLFSLIPFRAIEDCHFFATREMNGFRSRNFAELIDNSNVGEGSTSHYCVVATPRSVRVEVSWNQTAIGQVLSSRTGPSNRASWGNVIGCDWVAQVQEDASISGNTRKNWII